MNSKIRFLTCRVLCKVYLVQNFLAWKAGWVGNFIAKGD
jgi:hypothetical protein